VAAALVVALVAGTVATAWRARVAGGERARAERRLQDVKRMASSLLFEFDDVIQRLPGSRPARRLLVARGLDYLDRLARERQGDPSMARELAEGYLRVGDIQGGPDAASLGDAAGALASYRKALSLQEAAVAAAPTDPEQARRLLIVKARIRGLLSKSEGAPRSSAASGEALPAPPRGTSWDACSCGAAAPDARTAAAPGAGSSTRASGPRPGSGG
jgi:eukaryotic-like serine/threonine-protein kinase